MIRTGYSFGAAVGDIEEVMLRLKAMGWTHAPIADRNSTFGYAKWTAAAKKHGLIPVYGVEIGVTTDRYKKKPDVDYFVFLAQDDIASVNKLVALATDQTNHEPLLTYEQALNAEGVIVMTGSHPNVDAMLKWGIWCDDQHEFDGWKAYWSITPATPPAIIKEIRELKVPFIVRPDNQFCNEGDDILYHTICERWSRSLTTPQHIASDDEIIAVLCDKTSDGKRAAKIMEVGVPERLTALDDCTAKLATASLYKPKTKFNIMEECVRGATELRISLADPRYGDRLTYELDVIEAKAFTDYFQIIADVCRWARARMFVGPARGSSCGSLVCYLLGITSIDPIPHGLLFDRFIDVNRSDLPDIDIDFSDQHRSEVFEYIKATYGAGHVARLGTVSIFRARSSLAVAGKALGVPPYRTDALADIIEPKALGAEDRNLSARDAFSGTDVGRKLVDEFPGLRIVERMEGQPRHFSQHAAGVVLTEQSIDTYVAVDSRTGATQCDKYDAEKLNLLKVDILGLIQLSIIEDCIDMLDMKRDVLFAWPLNDQAAYDLLDRGDFAGIFQFNGRALQGLASQVKIQRFEDIVSITALARPGPLNSGMSQQWVLRKKGQQRVEKWHPIIDGILEETLGVLTYQEQIMKICRDVGNMTWESVNAVRRGMGKSMGVEYFSKYRDAFVIGAMSRNMSEGDASDLWAQMVEFGAYAFNKSHSVAYAMISYWCAVLKAHHPMEFYAATLSHMDDQDRKIEILRAAVLSGLDYVPFDPNLSTSKWTIGNFDGLPKLVGPVSGIIGIGPVMLAEVMSERQGRGKTSDRTQKLLAKGETDVDTIFPIKDRIAKLYPDGVPNIVTRPTNIRDVQNTSFGGSPLIMGVIVGMKEKKGKYGPELNLFVKDDTGELFVKVYSSHYDSIGKDIMRRGGKGKMIYAFKGNVREGDFRMLTLTKCKFIGDTGK